MFCVILIVSKSFVNSYVLAKDQASFLTDFCKEIIRNADPADIITISPTIIEPETLDFVSEKPLTQMLDKYLDETISNKNVTINPFDI